MIDWQKRYIPEICMAIHMHHTGACDDMTDDDHEAAIAYLESRVSAWNMHSNGRRWLGFDAQVLSLCLAVLAEASDWMAERTAISESSRL